MLVFSTFPPCSPGAPSSPFSPCYEDSYNTCHHRQLNQNSKLRTGSVLLERPWGRTQTRTQHNTTQHKWVVIVGGERGSVVSSPLAVT